MFKSLVFSLSFAVLLAVGWYYWATQPAGHEKISREFVISSQESLDSIVDRLGQAGLIRSRTAFKLTVYRLNLARKIQAGFFNISPSSTATDIANQLIKASRKSVRVTIPEGLRREEIAKLLHKALSVDPKSQFSPTDFITQTKNLEGKLFPDTYDLDPQSTTAGVIKVLIDQFNKRVSGLNIPESELVRIVTLASLIEREAGSLSEMPMVSGVIKNRLENDWPLQIDATVQYAKASLVCQKTPLDCTWWPANLTRDDIAINSPYNTYKFASIPPSPISSPGYSAIAAAANPENTPYFFYLHDSQGQIHFAVSLAEHNQNICQYLKKDCK